MHRNWLFLCLLLAVAPAAAQDPVKVDSGHYQVVFENDQVRVLRITYKPGEKSVMHAHPDAVAVFLADGEVRFNLPDKTTQDQKNKRGDAVFTPAGQHLPENTGKGPIEVVLVELKKSGPGN